jgi:hypothetical protein
MQEKVAEPACFTRAAGDSNVLRLGYCIPRLSTHANWKLFSTGLRENGGKFKYQTAINCDVQAFLWRFITMCTTYSWATDNTG